MSNQANPNALQDILEKIDSATDSQSAVSVDDVLNAVGRRSFGPLLVIIGLILAIPGVGDIPGIPTICGLIIILVIDQQLLGKQHIWLPNVLLNRSIKATYIEKTILYAKKPAKKIDSFTTKRLNFLVENKLSWYLTSLACLSIAVTTPAMEVVFLSANIAGVSLLLFGLSYITQDGLVALLSFLVYSALIYIIGIGII